MCIGGSPPKPPKPEPPPPSAPAPAPEPPPPPMAPAPELVNANAEAPKVTAQKTARGQAQQAAQGTGRLTIPKQSVNTGGGASGGGGNKSGSLNIPT